MSKKFQDAPFDLSAEIRPLIHKLGMATGEEGRGAILTFIAARRGEGTTTVARSFVQALNTETGKRILLIEAGAEEDATGSGIVELAASGTNIAASLTEAGSGIFVGQWVASPQGRTKRAALFRIRVSGNRCKIASTSLSSMRRLCNLHRTVSPLRKLPAQPFW